MRRALLTTRAFGVTASCYGPNERQGWHTDRHSRVSFLLCGAYREDGPSGSVRASPGEIVLKSWRARHEDAFGPEGALLVSLEYYENDPFEAVGESALWRPRADADALRHAIALLDAAIAGDSEAVTIAGADLVGEHDGAGERRAAAPKWLERLKADLEQSGFASVSVAERAREAGVHPVHASRLFRRSYGVSITEHAQAHSVRRSLPLLATPCLSLSEVAVCAGFYDQSHMNRVFRRSTGRTPAGLRALIVAAGG